MELASDSTLSKGTAVLPMVDLVSYHHPEMTGTIDCKHDVDIDNLDVARDMGCDDLPKDSSPEFSALAELIMTEEGLGMPENAKEAQNLYLTLVNEIEKLMQLHIYENGRQETC